MSLLGEIAVEHAMHDLSDDLKKLSDDYVNSPEITAVILEIHSMLLKELLIKPNWWVNNEAHIKEGFITDHQL